MTSILGDFKPAGAFQAAPDEATTSTASTSEGNDVEMASTAEEPSFMDEYFSQVAEIKAQISSIKSQAKRIDQLYKANLEEVVESERDRRTTEVNKLQSEITNSINTIRDGLKTIDESNKKSIRENGYTAETRMRENLHALLTKRFVDVVKSYHEIQQAAQRQQREKTKRQIQIAEQSAEPPSDERVDQIMSSGNQDIFGQVLVQSSTQKQAAMILNDIKQRHTELQRLEASIMEVHQLFADVAVLVNAQAELLSNIEFSLSKSVEYTQKGNKELTKTIKSQKRYRKKLYLITCCGLIVIAVVLGSVFGSGAGNAFLVDAY